MEYIAIQEGVAVTVVIHLQIGEMCHTERLGGSDNQMTCSDESILDSLHLFLVSYLLRVRPKSVISRVKFNTIITHVWP